MGRTGIALGRMDVNLDTSTTIGSLLPACFGGTPNCTLICNNCCEGIAIGNLKVLLSIASCSALTAASVASPHDEDADESIPNPILDIESTVLLASVAAWCGAEAVGKE